jgi:pimeloyl-ACP methyl ester carboxylesterase
MKLEHIKKLHPDGNHKASVLLVHGACMGAWVWHDNFSPYLYERGFNVHSISLRNHGRSFKNESIRSISILDYVDDLKSIIKELDGDVFIIGHSMGGFTIQHYMQECDSKIKGVVLLCPVPNTGLWQLIPKLVLHYPFYFMLSSLKMSWLPIIKNNRRLKRLMFSDSYPINKMRVVADAVQEESFLVFLEMVFLRLPKISSSPVPMMVVGAENDYLISEQSIKKMAAYFRVEPLIIKDAAHCFMFEPGWEKVAEEITNFFGGLVPTSN